MFMESTVIAKSRRSPVVYELWYAISVLTVVYTLGSLVLWTLSLTEYAYIYGIPLLK